MPEQSQGSLEIEQTLRLARDAVERDIARYRVWVFGTIAVVTAIVPIVLGERSWIPTLFFLGALGYALVLRAVIARVGNRPSIALVSVVLDLALNGAVFHVVRQLGPEVTRAQNPIFVAYILGPALFITLFIGSLRSSLAISVTGAIVAPVVFFATIVPLAGFHPAQIPVAVILVAAALLGAVMASQARKNLDSFARLQLLRRYLPPAAVERVMRDDPDMALSLGGRLTTVTVLAADLRGFTAMSEKLAPNEVMTQLNAYHGAMIDVIDQHGGAIDKFIGDGTLVVFGLADSTEGAAAAAAVACAGAMLDALSRHNEARARAGMTPLQMGIGVHTGPVIAGNLGVPGRRLEFTVIGDAVNTASRLEGQTKLVGTPVIVSATTAELLADASALRELPPVSLRGKVEEMRVFGLCRVDDARDGDSAQGPTEVR